MFLTKGEQVSDDGPCDAGLRQFRPLRVLDEIFKEM
jgi:hypothetical protein